MQEKREEGDRGGIVSELEEEKEEGKRKFFTRSGREPKINLCFMKKVCILSSRSMSQFK